MNLGKGNSPPRIRDLRSVHIASVYSPSPISLHVRIQTETSSTDTKVERRWRSYDLEESFNRCLEKHSKTEAWLSKQKKFALTRKRYIARGI